MIVEYVRYVIPAPRQAAFEAAIGAAQAHLQASPHCLSYELARCVEAPEHYILRVEWDSLSGHKEGFHGSAHGPALLDAIRPFFDTIVEAQHYAPTPVRSAERQP